VGRGRLGPQLLENLHNNADRWSEDVSEDIAREIMRRLGLAGDELPTSLEAFVDSHLGSDRQLTLRLA
jgi:hypothetical protein